MYGGLILLKIISLLHYLLYFYKFEQDHFVCSATFANWNRFVIYLCSEMEYFYSSQYNMFCYSNFFLTPALFFVFLCLCVTFKQIDAFRMPNCTLKKLVKKYDMLCVFSKNIRLQRKQQRVNSGWVCEVNSQIRTQCFKLCTDILLCKH